MIVRVSVVLKRTVFGDIDRRFDIVATQTVYKPLFHFVAKLNNKSLIRRFSV